MYMYTSRNIYIYIYVCVYVYIYMYICVCISIHSKRGPGNPTPQSGCHSAKAPRIGFVLRLTAPFIHQTHPRGESGLLQLPP